MRYLVWYGDHLLDVTGTTDTSSVEIAKHQPEQSKPRDPESREYVDI